MAGFASKRKMGLSRMGDEVQASPPSEDWGLSRARDWKLKLCLTPKKCFLSEKPLWGKRAYHGVRTITGPGDPVYEDYWIEKNEFMIWNLKGRQ
jgi:hypothetical protein